MLGHACARPRRWLIVNTEPHPVSADCSTSISAFHNFRLTWSFCVALRLHQSWWAAAGGFRLKTKLGGKRNTEHIKKTRHYLHCSWSKEEERGIVAEKMYESRHCHNLDETTNARACRRQCTQRNVGDFNLPFLAKVSITAVTSSTDKNQVWPLAERFGGATDWSSGIAVLGVSYMHIEDASFLY